MTKWLTMQMTTIQLYIDETKRYDNTKQYDEN